MKEASPHLLKSSSLACHRLKVVTEFHLIHCKSLVVLKWNYLQPNVEYSRSLIWILLILRVIIIYRQHILAFRLRANCFWRKCFGSSFFKHKVRFQCSILLSIFLELTMAQFRETLNLNYLMAIFASSYANFCFVSIALHHS